MNKFWIGITLVACLAVWGVHSTVNTGHAEEAKQATFVGAAKCKTCHKTAAAGEQFPIWEKSEHAKAFETLASEKSMEIAKKLGIEDPQKDEKCLMCHVTAHGVAAESLGPKFAATDGVSCESCHGAGGNYYKSKTMKAIAKGEIEAASVGLIKPTKEVCVECHNDKSPTYVEFDFEKRLAQIAHPIPAERRAKYKAAE